MNEQNVAIELARKEVDHFFGEWTARIQELKFAIDAEDAARKRWLDARARFGELEAEATE